MTVARVAYVLLSLCCAAKSHEFAAPTATCSSPDCITDDGAHGLELLQKTMEVDSQQAKPSHVKVEDATDMIKQMKAKDETIEFLQTSLAYWRNRALSGGSGQVKLLQKTMEVDSQQVKPSHVKVEDATDMIKQMKAKDETIEFLKDSVLPKTRGSISDGEPRVFVIGANKAATTTLNELFLSMGRRSCHDVCSDKNGNERARWDRTSHEKNASSPLWHLYNAFADHGDNADYKWLDTAFPGSRFVLNTRAMQPWMLSSYDHVRTHREMYGCEPQGNSSSCKGHESCNGNSSSCKGNESEWLDNSDEWVAERIASAAAHQEEVMAYFDAHKERRQRFIVVDVAGWKPEEVMLPLRWVMRPKLEELPTDRLLVSRGQMQMYLANVPSKAQDALHAAPDTPRSVHANATSKAQDALHAEPPDTPSAVHANPRGHPKHSEETVNRALRKLVRCPESMWQDVLYAKCAAYIEGKGVVPAW